MSGEWGMGNGESFLFKGTPIKPSWFSLAQLSDKIAILQYNHTAI